MAGMADATFTAVDLSRLPAPDIIEALDSRDDPADAAAQMRDEMAKSGLTFETRDSDPATKLLQVFAYYAQMLRQRINDAARAVMPAYAVKADLDHIAALFGITRLTITPANPATGAPAVMEDDTDFRRRMVLAPEGYSVAGPEGPISPTRCPPMRTCSMPAPPARSPTISRPSCWACWPTMRLRPIWSRP
jgi:phage-related baseplate assembly protein